MLNIQQNLLTPESKQPFQNKNFKEDHSMQEFNVQIEQKAHKSQFLDQQYTKNILIPQVRVQQTGKDFKIIMNSDKQMHTDSESITCTYTHDFDCQMNDTDQSTFLNKNQSQSSQNNFYSFQDQAQSKDGCSQESNLYSEINFDQYNRDQKQIQSDANNLFTQTLFKSIPLAHFQNKANAQAQGLSMNDNNEFSRKSKASQLACKKQGAILKVNLKKQKIQVKKINKQNSQNNSNIKSQTLKKLIKISAEKEHNLQQEKSESKNNLSVKKLSCSNQKKHLQENYSPNNSNNKNQCQNEDQEDLSENKQKSKSKKQNIQHSEKTASSFDSETQNQNQKDYSFLLHNEGYTNAGNNEEELKIFQQRLQNSSETAYSLNKDHEMWEKQSSIPMICVESMDDENIKLKLSMKRFKINDSPKDISNEKQGMVDVRADCQSISTTNSNSMSDKIRSLNKDDIVDQIIKNQKYESPLLDESQNKIQNSSNYIDEQYLAIHDNLKGNLSILDSNQPLRVSLQNDYQGDRFIPKRQPGCKNNQEKYEIQFEHEENVLKFQTQYRKKKQNKKNLLNSSEINNPQNLLDYQNLNESEFQMYNFNEQSHGNTEMLLDSPETGNQKSKGNSPNDVKNKQTYQNLLAQQCLGDEILRVQSQVQNLAQPLINFPNSQSINQNDSLLKKFEDQNRFLNGTKSMFLDPNLQIDQIHSNIFTDPFQDYQLNQRKTTIFFNSENEYRHQISPFGTSDSPLKQENINPLSCNKILDMTQACPKNNLSNLNTFHESFFNPTKINFGLNNDADDYEYNNEDQTDSEQTQSYKPRRINKMPFKVLDAPQLQDDFYLNLVDWSSQNILAVGLNRSVYIWSACTSQVKKLCETGFDNKVTSVGWSNKGGHLAVGTDNGNTEIWDINHGKVIRTLGDHHGRISSIAWNGSTLSTGSRDRMILSRDLRMKQSITHKHIGHKQEICGLKWSFDGQQLASGGNDNKLMIWNLKSESPVAKFGEHLAAVKAIAWNPNQAGLLATGGGTADKCIRFWNTHTLQPINVIDTGSQVCNLMFSKTSNEIVSTHGYSLNQIIVWKYPSMQKVATLTGHSYRVLYLSMSPCGQNIVTGAGDETLRFWNIFPSMKNCGISSGANSLSSTLH